VRTPSPSGHPKSAAATPVAGRCPTVRNGKTFWRLIFY
jgi:hypothetical protein